jgi:hypothetical protein
MISRRRTKQRHTAGYQAVDGRIYYRFHARFGECVAILRRQRFQGADVFVIEQSDGTLAHIPCWMMRGDAMYLDVQPHPRLSLASLRDLRIEVSSLVNFLESDLPMEEASDETRTAISAPGSVRRHRPGNSATAVEPEDPHGTGESPSERGRHRDGEDRGGVR